MDFMEKVRRVLAESVGRDDLSHIAAFDALATLVENWDDAVRNGCVPEALISDIDDVILILSDAKQEIQRSRQKLIEIH